jgi:hypothetical protein
MRNIKFYFKSSLKLYAGEVRRKIGPYPWCRFGLYLFNGFIEFLQITSITKPLLMRSYEPILMYIGPSIKDIFKYYVWIGPDPL